MKMLRIALAGAACLFAAWLFQTSVNDSSARLASPSVPILPQQPSVTELPASLPADKPLTIKNSVAKPNEATVAEPTSMSDESFLPLREEPTIDLTEFREVELWNFSTAKEIQIDDIPATQFATDPNIFAALHVGQTLRLPLPDGDMVESEIVRTYNDLNGVQVWKGILKNEISATGIIITRGQTQTHIAIASTQGSYTVIVNNQTGISTLIDEGAIHERQLPIDDGIALPPSAAEISQHSPYKPQ